MHFFKTLTITLLLGLASCQSQDTLPPLSPHPSTLSTTPISLSPNEHFLWVVNPDADSVTKVDVQSQQVITIPVGKEPWAVVAVDDGALVLNRADGSLSRVRNDRQDAVLPLGAEPVGMALSPSGNYLFVTLSSEDAVLTIDIAKWQVIERKDVGRLPWSIAIAHTGDGSDEVIVVSHHLARLRSNGVEGSNAGKEAWLSVIYPDGSLHERHISPYDFGFANVVEGLTVHSNTILTSHLLNSPDPPRAPFHTLSGAMTLFSLQQDEEEATLRLHLNDDTFSTPSNFPRALAINQTGNEVYIVLAGADSIMGIDIRNVAKPKLLGFWAVGKNPRGIALNRAGTHAYVMNYLSRDVTVLDLTDLVRRPALAHIPVVTETLDAQMLQGKILFNKANDPRMSTLGWISCASCHVDGGVDGTTWGTPEGMRQTMPLWNLAGTAPFHISATRDEIQDFEFDIENFMGGVGLASGSAHTLLGTPNGGRSSDLDALSHFVLEGIRPPQASTLVEHTLIAEGRKLFVEANCHSCHGGLHWTRSNLPAKVGSLTPNGEVEVEAVLHDVGTYAPEGDILGAKGFDIPTLLSLHASAPYLHDGRATSLDTVLANRKHVQQTFSEVEKRALIAFLLSIDATTEAMP